METRRTLPDARRRSRPSRSYLHHHRCLLAWWASSATGKLSAGGTGEGWPKSDRHASTPGPHATLDKLAGLEAEDPAAATGNTLLHLDLRADNLLLTPDDRVLVVDWPHARMGASWVDAVFFAPSATMQDGPPPEELLAHYLTGGKPIPMP